MNNAAKCALRNSDENTDNLISVLHLQGVFAVVVLLNFLFFLFVEAANDPLVKVVFHEAGVLLGSHVRAISSHFDQVGNFSMSLSN